MKNIKIKICGIKNTTILKCCNRLNVDFIGLVFFKKSPRYVDIEKAAQLINYQDSRNSIPVGVFVNKDFDDLSFLINRIKLKFLQLHGNENNEYIKKLKNKHNIKVIKSLGIQNENDLNQVKNYPHADIFIFDYKPQKNELPGGNAKSFNWSILKKLKIVQPWMLSGGINKNNINYILENLDPYGIDISSGVEDQPGIKKSSKIKEVVEIINEK